MCWLLFQTNHHALLASSLDYSFISISLEETNILHVPFPKLKDIYAKANQIQSSAESDIQWFSNDTTYVASKSSPHNPHKVLCKGNSKFTCNSSHVNWATYKFCTDTLAVAEGYKETVLFVDNVAFKAKPNVMSLALLDMPKGTGNKGTKSTSRRKGGPVQMKHPMVKVYNNSYAALPIEQLTSWQATVQQATG